MQTRMLSLRALSAGALLTALAGSASGQCGQYLDLLDASDKAASDEFGTSLALGQNSSGGMMLMIGAPNHDVGALNASGMVYTFSKINGQWGQTGVAFPNDGATFDYFGSAIQFRDPYMIVGAPGAGVGGAAYIMERFGSTWSERLKHTGATGDGVGNAVGISDTMAVVGAPNSDVTQNNITDANAGRVYMYRRNANGTWASAGSLVLMASVREPEDHYGAAVATYGNRVMTGIPGFNAYDIQTQTYIDNAGAVEIARYDAATTTWFADGWMIDPEPYQDDKFGAVVAINDTYCAVTALGREIGNTVNVGVVYMYRHNGQQWVADGELRPVSPVNNAGFGSSLDISGDRIIVGSSYQHQVHVFRRVAAGQWVVEARYTDPDGPDGFGESVSIFGAEIAIGDPLEDPAGIADAGAAYVYQISANSADTCAGATPVLASHTYNACTQNATVDGSSSCGGLQSSPDIWFKYTATGNGNITLNTFGSAIDTILSVHSGCPGTGSNAIACNDDFSIFEEDSSVTFYAQSGQTYMIRISGKGTTRGAVTLNVGAQQNGCYANCDNSTTAPVLNVADFTCFLQRYAAGEAYANCDTSTTAPALNVADFTCFLQRYAQGCN